MIYFELKVLLFVFWVSRICIFNGMSFIVNVGFLNEKCTYDYLLFTGGYANLKIIYLFVTIFRITFQF